MTSFFSDSRNDINYEAQLTLSETLTMELINRNEILDFTLCLWLQLPSLEIDFTMSLDESGRNSVLIKIGQNISINIFEKTR